MHAAKTPRTVKVGFRRREGERQKCCLPKVFEKKSYSSGYISYNVTDKSGIRIHIPGGMPPTDPSIVTGNSGINPGSVYGDEPPPPDGAMAGRSGISGYPDAELTRGGCRHGESYGVLLNVLGIQCHS